MAESANLTPSQLAETVLVDEESAQVYKVILADRMRARIDPDFADDTSIEKSERRTEPYIELTERYIRLSARLADSASALMPASQTGREPMVMFAGSADSADFSASESALPGSLEDRGATFRSLISYIWEPLPGSETTDFYVIETLCAAIMSNQVVGMLAGPLENRARQYTWSGYRDELGIRARLTAAVEPLCGEVTQKLERSFTTVFLNANTEAAIRFATDRLEAQEPLVEGGGVWPHVDVDEGLHTPGVGQLPYGAIFCDIPLEQDPIAHALDNWLLQKKAGGGHPEMSPQDPQLPSHSSLLFHGQSLPPSPFNPPAIQPTTSQQAYIATPVNSATPRVVWFGTRREPRTTQPGPVPAVTEFGDKKDASMHYGSWEIAVPNSLMSTANLSKDKPLITTPKSVADEKELCREIEAALLNNWGAAQRDILVYVHGFNTSFEIAMRDARWLSACLNFSGELVCFSWPAGAKQFWNHYWFSGGRAENAKDDLAAFLTALLDTTGARRVHVIAHSMGVRTLALAMQTVYANKLGRSNVGQIMIVAGDMRRGKFRSEASFCSGQAKRASIYASSTDSALWWAARLSRPAMNIPSVLVPVGLVVATAGVPIALIRDLDTVDVSTPGGASAWGHMYHVQIPQIYQDMSHLVERDMDPPNKQDTHPARPPRQLPPARFGSRIYWKMA